MTIVETLATSGAVLGIVVVLLLQQFGLVALPDLVMTLIVFLAAIATGAVIFAVVGNAVEKG